LRRDSNGKLSVEEEKQTINVAKQIRIEHQTATIDWTVKKAMGIPN
jgi:hypothetical protein